jgi:hypothetical protein
LAKVIGFPAEARVVTGLRYSQDLEKKVSPEYRDWILLVR